MRIRLVISICLSIGMLTSCGIDAVHEYERREPAIGRSTPTKFQVRIKLDMPSKSVVWVEDVSDGGGELGRTLKTYTSCDVYNEGNWRCAESMNDEIEMADGKLRQRYWTEQRAFRRAIKLG